MNNYPLVTDFQNYKDFLASITGSAKRRSGIKSQIAQALNCQVSYVSRVLHQDAHFSMEQGEALTKFLKLNNNDKDFFMLLLIKDRSGSVSLKNYYQQKINERLKKNQRIQDRLQEKETTISQLQQTYYSSLHYTLIHMACTIPSLRNPEALAEHFMLPIDQVHAAIDFLIQSQYLERSDKGYIPTSQTIFIDKSNPLIRSHHSNIRLEALQSLRSPIASENNLHYSAVVSLSHSDVLKIKERLLKEISACVSIVKTSNEETLYGLGIDYFDLGKNL